MTPEEQALLRRYGQRKRHELGALRKSDREAETQRLNVLDAIYRDSLNKRNAPFYAQAVAEQRHYENMECLGRATQKFAESVRGALLPALTRATESVKEVVRVLEEAKALA